MCLEAALLIAVLAEGPEKADLVVGQPSSTAGIPDGWPAKTEAAIHALSGVVRAVDATRLVITRRGKTSREMTFLLRSSTQLDGSIVAGAAVQVRFRLERGLLVATAVFATPQNRHSPARKTP